MAIRKSKEETFLVKGNVEEWLIKVNKALHKGNFTNIKANQSLYQLTADYKKMTVWGEIIITLLAEREEQTRINAKSTANSDNIFALFSSPNQKIINQFKSNI